MKNHKDIRDIVIGLYDLIDKSDLDTYNSAQLLYDEFLDFDKRRQQQPDIITELQSIIDAYKNHSRT